MTVAQILSVGIIAATMGLFVWGRLRYDLVALISLLAAIVAGIVRPTRRSRASPTTSSSSWRPPCW
jgi:hypothetical protein